MSQAGEGDADELARRFKALFNKEPLSQAPKDESPWRLQGQADDYEIDDEELGNLVEESAALNDSDVKELIGLSRTAVKEGTSSKPEAHDLLEKAKTATQEPHNPQDTNDISEEEIEALLRQLGDEPYTVTSDAEGQVSKSHEQVDKPSENSAIPDDSAEVAAILSQLTDAAHLEQKFDDQDSEPATPSTPGLSLPSVPKAESTEDDLSARLANLKTFPPQNYTGKDRGSINVFVPGIAKVDDDDSIHWCDICNDDATIQCLGCEGDKYCDSCFKEGHSQPDTRKHRWRRYKRKAQAF